jgi:hypothetical protein
LKWCVAGGRASVLAGANNQFFGWNYQAWVPDSAHKIGGAAKGANAMRRLLAIVAMPMWVPLHFGSSVKLMPFYFSPYRSDASIVAHGRAVARVLVELLLLDPGLLLGQSLGNQRTAIRVLWIAVPHADILVPPANEFVLLLDLGVDGVFE